MFDRPTVPFIVQTVNIHHKEVPMRCPRCQGLLVRDSFNDVRLEDAQVHAAVRCVNCGFLADQLILARWLSYRQQASAEVPVSEVSHA